MTALELLTDKQAKKLIVRSYKYKQANKRLQEDIAELVRKNHVLSATLTVADAAVALADMCLEKYKAKKTDNELLEYRLEGEIQKRKVADECSISLLRQLERAECKLRDVQSRL
jgi:hypothetical protein